MDMRSCNIVLRQSKKCYVSYDSAYVAMRVITCPGGVAYFFAAGVPNAFFAALCIGNAYDQRNLFLVCKGGNIAVPVRKAADVRFYVSVVDPYSCVGVNAFKTQYKLFRTVPFGQFQRSLVIVFRVVFYVKALHDQRGGRDHLLPFGIVDRVKIIILIFCIGRRNVLYLAKQKFPFAAHAVGDALFQIFMLPDLIGHFGNIGYIQIFAAHTITSCSE